MSVPLMRCAAAGQSSNPSPAKRKRPVNLRIGALLPLIISALALMAMVSAGFAAYQAFGRRQEAEAFLRVNQISQLLLRSAGQWAIERGLTNTALKSPDALPAERRADIVKRRETADRAFRDAMPLLRAIPAMKPVERQIEAAESADRKFESFRSKVDENLAKPGTGRVPEVMESLVPTITNLIDLAAVKLRLTMETLTTPPTAALSQLV